MHAFVGACSQLQQLRMGNMLQGWAASARVFEGCIGSNTALQRLWLQWPRWRGQAFDSLPGAAVACLARCPALTLLYLDGIGVGEGDLCALAAGCSALVRLHATSPCTAAAAQQLVRALEHEHRRRELVVSLALPGGGLVAGVTREWAASRYHWGQALFEEWGAG